MAVTAEATKKVAGDAIDVITDIIAKTTGKSTDLAKNIAHAIVDKPAIAALVAKMGKVGIDWIKAGGLTTFIANFAKFKQAGMSVKGAFTSALSKASSNLGVSVRGFQQAGTVGKVGTVAGGVAKLLAIIAATQVAKMTVEAAAKQAEVKFEAFKNKPNIKTAWELFWETTIPVATYRWIEAAIKKGDIHATPGFTKEEMKKKKEATSDVFISDDSGIRPDQKKLDQKKAELDTQYNEAAKGFEMVERPTHPQAEREWEKEVERRMANKGTNNPEWYKQGKFNGIKCSGTYNYDTKNGNPATSPLPSFANVGRTYVSETGLPSVGALQLILTVGKAYNDMLENEFTDITIKLKALNKNSALTTSWNKSDLLALIHNMRVAYAAWCVGRRAYKLVNEFKSTDLTLPYAYFAAMGLDYESWQSARAQIQEDLITMSSRMSVFIDFGKLNLFKRTEQLFEYGYQDGKSIKSQAILFSVSTLTKYFDFNNSMAGTAANVNGDPVTDISATSTGMTYIQWKANFLAIINSMLDNAKVNDMMSCLRYALGTTKEPLFKIPSPSEKLIFKYDPEVMAQIENCTLLGSTSDVTYNLGISGNWISETVARTNAITKKIVNTHMTDVPKDDEIVLGRLQVAKLTPPGSTTPEWYWGTEIAVIFCIITTYESSTHYRKLEYWQFYDQMKLPMHVTSNNDQNKVTATEQLTKIGLISSFDWAPIIPFKFEMGSVTATAVTLVVDGVVNADWENYAVAFDTSVDSSLVWMSYLRNGNYSLYSNLQYLLDTVLDKAKTA